MSHAFQRAPSRFAALRRFRLGDFPLLPIADPRHDRASSRSSPNLLAPHNPEVGMLTARFKPPFWMSARHLRVPARHRPARARRAVAADLRRPGVDDRRHHRGSCRRRHRHDARHHLGLSRRLGRSGRHAADRYLAGAAGADLRDLSRRDRRPEHVEHRHHPRRRLLDAIRARRPRRGAVAEGTRVRPPRRSSPAARS